ncbi:restriction endonuclease subunit S [Sphingobacterium sp. R2]|uniref:restriction endonuclease subunit S n=1 Tax=Sphingobacterium sp. R2 TaxID=3112958 RepID=UPI00345DBBB2
MKGLEVSEILKSNLEYSGRIDAEYYKPGYLKFESLVKSKKGGVLSEKVSFLIGPFGSAFTVDNYVEEPVYRYIRGKDVKPLKLMNDDNVYMSKEHYNSLSRYHLRENDVMVSVVGTIGNAAIIQKQDLPAVFSCKNTVIRSSEINPKYLLAYLNSKYGRELLHRKERGAIQKGLNLDDLKNLDIFLASVKFENAIEKIFDISNLNINASMQQYSQAERLLLEILGLHDIQLSTDAVNIKSFKESFFKTGRLDAEYYQPKYEQLEKYIKFLEYKRLGSIVKIRKSIEPGSDAYQGEGIPFVRISNLNKFGVSTPDIYLDKQLFENVIRPKKNTILLSKDGSVGIAYKIEEDADYITSGAILHLEVTDVNILPDYLTLVLNSIVVKMQSERDAGGSIIQHWKPSEIEQAIIPIVDLNKQQEIVDLVRESFKLRAKSENLLKVAMRAVEIAIEYNEDKAIEYVDENNQ